MFFNCLLKSQYIDWNGLTMSPNITPWQWSSKVVLKAVDNEARRRKVGWLPCRGGPGVHWGTLSGGSSLIRPCIISPPWLVLQRQLKGMKYVGEYFLLTIRISVDLHNLAQIQIYKDSFTKKYVETLPSSKLVYERYAHQTLVFAQNEIHVCRKCSRTKMKTWHYRKKQRWICNPIFSCTTSSLSPLSSITDWLLIRTYSCYP